MGTVTNNSTPKLNNRPRALAQGTVSCPRQASFRQSSGGLIAPPRVRVPAATRVPCYMLCFDGLLVFNFGAILGPSWAILGLLGAILGPSWGHHGPSWGHLGAILGPSWAILGPCWAILGPSWAILGLLGAKISPSPKILKNNCFFK